MVLEAAKSQYRQVADLLRAAIERDEYAPGSLLPWESELAAEYGVSRVTINRAVQLLRGEGMVRVLRGRGTAVRAIPPIRRNSNLRYARCSREEEGSRGAFDFELKRLGPKSATKLAQLGQVPAPEPAPEVLGLAATDTVLIRKREMYASDEPVLLATTYFPWTLAGQAEVTETDTGPSGYLLTPYRDRERPGPVQRGPAGAHADSGRRALLRPRRDSAGLRDRAHLLPSRRHRLRVPRGRAPDPQVGHALRVERQEQHQERGVQAMSPMLDVVAAELPGNGTTSEDRVRVSANAVPVLNGATGSDTRVTVADYIDHLAGAFIEVLGAEPDMPLPHAFAGAIRSTVGALRVMSGESPSSTVSIARRRGDEVDLLVLGDSSIYIGPNSLLLTDDRLAQLDLPSRTKANERLRNGTGYDDVQRDLVHAVHVEQQPWLNEPGGYWIAEARLEAAHQAAFRTVSADVPWLVMLTDGVDKPLRHLGISPAVGLNCTTAGLRDFLEQLHGWEDERDPDVQASPRFKRHDDKTMALVTFP